MCFWFRFWIKLTDQQPHWMITSMPSNGKLFLLQIKTNGRNEMDYSSTSADNVIWIINIDVGNVARSTCSTTNRQRYTVKRLALPKVTCSFNSQLSALSRASKHVLLTHMSSLNLIGACWLNMPTTI